MQNTACAAPAMHVSRHPLLTPELATMHKQSLRCTMDLTRWDTLQLKELRRLSWSRGDALHGMLYMGAAALRSSFKLCFSCLLSAMAA